MGCGKRPVTGAQAMTMRNDVARDGAWYLISASLAVVGVLVLGPQAHGYFRPFIGQISPMFAVLTAAVVGAGALTLLRRRMGISIAPPRTGLRRGAGFVAAGVAAFGAAITLADVLLRYPRDINAPMPHALLFYPVIGFVAEIAFHVVPMSVVSLLLALSTRRVGTSRAPWLPFAVAAITEPAFQMVFAGEPLSAIGIYTGLHVLGFSTLQMVVCRRYGFVMMLVTRLAYYVIWHMTWGVIRLEVLFGG